jgi:hypothetical protein
MIDPRISTEFDRRAPFALKDATVLVLATIGSHSHNTYVPKDDPQAIDDTDYMLIVVPPPSYVLGVKQWEGVSFQIDELDVVVYSFAKLVRLLLKANPNVLGLLWLPEHCYVETHPLWTHVLAYRSAFSSKAAYHSFIGYAHGQMTKMESFDVSIRAEWQEALGIITACGWTRDQVTSNAHREMPATLNYDADKIAWAIETVRRIHARHFQGYMGEKRKALVERYGFDTKNAAHLIRLMRMCVEFLRTGALRVWRTTDAEHLRAIKAGRVSLADVKTEAGDLFERARAARDASLLAEAADVEMADALAQRVHRACV